MSGVGKPIFDSNSGPGCEVPIGVSSTFPPDFVIGMDALDALLILDLGKTVASELSTSVSTTFTKTLALAFALEALDASILFFFAGVKMILVDFTEATTGPKGSSSPAVRSEFWLLDLSFFEDLCNIFGGLAQL